MRGTSTWVVVVCAMATSACGAGETRLDPGELALDDLLGVAPEVAVAWDADQRAAARRVLATALDDDALAALEEPRAASGGSLVLATEWDGHTWSGLPARGGALLVALAGQAEQRGRIVVEPAPRAPAIASVEQARLRVNPVVLAAIEPVADELATAAQLERVTPAVPVARGATRGEAAYAPVPPQAVAAAGNPYSFYGSVAECAFAQRARCEACVGDGSCEPITDSDGTMECNRLAEANGRGYYLICINLALAISSVENCAVETASACPRDTDAADALAELENNAVFLDDAACGRPLDACLAEIYGEPSDEFPDLDGGTTPPRAPRDPSIDCGDSCSDNNANCEASPNCDCSGPSCDNSLSCDSACASSNSGGSCDGCSDDGGCSDGGGSSGGGGGCSDSGSSSGDGCGGDCGGSCDNGGGSCGGGGGGSCAVARPSHGGGGLAFVLSLGWAFAPLPVALRMRTRARRRRDRAARSEEVTP